MSNVPKLRFKEFSGEWNKVKIQKLIDKKFITSHLDGNHGSLYPRSEEFTKEGVPYVTANDFVNGKVDLTKCKCLPLERASQFKKGIAKDGDVLFAHNATVGPVALLETDFDYVILSTTATYFRCDNENLINSYLRVYFNTNDFIKQYSRVMSQSTRNQVPITTQRLFYVMLPSKQEQEKIASFLTSVDTKVEQLTKKEELLKQYKKGVMQKIFSQQIRFKADDGSEFEDWEQKKLGDVFSGIKGQGLSKGDIIEDGINKCILYGELYTTYPEVIKDIASNTNSSSSVKSLKGDLLVPCSTTTTGIDLADVTALYEDDVLLGGDITILRFKKSGNSTFFAYYLTHHKKHDLAKYGQGSTIVHMYYSHFKTMLIKFPSSIVEQTKIANFLSSIDSKVKQVQKQLESTKQFKKALLQQMFV